MDHKTARTGARRKASWGLNPPYEHPRNEETISTESLSRGRLGRRTFLRGAGTALALPWLDAMLPRTARAARAAAKPPVRMAFLFSPNGVIPSAWTPAEIGANYTLSPTFAPLAAVRDEVLVLSGFSQKKGFDMGDGAGDHARSASTFLTGVHPYKTAGSNIRAGVSVDQFAAARIGRATPLPSLELGIDPGATAGNCDSGYSCAYSSCISWKTPTTPMAKEINPKLVFERLFGTARMDPQERARRDSLRKSILDLVREDSARLEKRLGTADRRKMDEYFSGIRELELRIELSARTADRRPPNVQVPAGVPDDFERHIHLMSDLLVLALQTDVTRIATFMFANEGSNRLYSMVGAKDGHHALVAPPEPGRARSRSCGTSTGIWSRNTPVSWRSCGRFRRVKGPCLTTAWFCTAAAWETATRTRTIICRSCWPAAAAARSSRDATCSSRAQTPLNNLLVSMLERVGAPAARFGDSTGPLSGLDG